MPQVSVQGFFQFFIATPGNATKNIGIIGSAKMFFCHGWNRAENMDLQLDHLPDRKYYYPESFETKRKREQFEEFYMENQNKPFLLSNALKEYCGKK